MQRICAELKRRGFAPVAPPAGEDWVFVGASAVEDFLGQLHGALAAGRNVVLVGPDWPPADLQEAERRVGAFSRTPEAARWREAEGPLVLIATSGTTGERRFAVHAESTLRAAAEAFVERFGAAAAASWNVLPLHHVGGLMTLVRALVAEAPWGHGHYRSLCEEAPPSALRASLSLVPTHPHRLMEDSVAQRRLRLFDRLFVGGAALGAREASRARGFELPLAPCYGLTETAAMIASLEPAEFLAGGDSCGLPLPHVELVFAEGAGTKAAPGAIGVRAPSVAPGLVPQVGFARDPLWTSDLGYRDAQGRLFVRGRLDRMILSGGEKIDPNHVEDILRGACGTDDIIVMGMPDADWGQRVVAVCTPDLSAEAREGGTWRGLLRAAERPKGWLEVPSIPRTPLGKVDLAALRRQLPE